MDKLLAFFRRSKVADQYQALADQEAQQARELRELGRANIRKGRGALGVKQIELSQEHKRLAASYKHGVTIERSKRDK